jgi:predicted O-methyltransferase YrrM
MGKYRGSLKRAGGRAKTSVFALARRPTRRQRLRQIQNLVDAGMPPEIRTALEYLVTGAADPSAQAVTKRAEERRREIATSIGTAPIWRSPKPGSAGAAVSEALRPEPGTAADFSMSKIAVTGKDSRWGTALYLVVREFGCTSGLELGTCAGISGIYISSAPMMAAYVTVEGSAALCKIANESLLGLEGVRVVNSLFDDALDSELPRLAGEIDFAFIDGHHEKVATIHYADRLLPALQDGSVIVFDDISWSVDMRQAWDALRNRYEWSDAIDLGPIGICIYRGESSPTTPPRQWNLQTIVGTRRIVKRRRG